MSDSEQIIIYQLKVFIMGITPMIWRWFKVHGNSTITDLHYIVQIVIGWTDSQASFAREASPAKLAHLHGNVFRGQQAIDRLVDDLEIEVFDDDRQLETKILILVRD
jgi:Plasmid pRiA4b ORF-3-like protein